MVDPKTALRSVFGCDELPLALFYEFDTALRFELGGEDTSTDRPIKRFIQAFERAEAIAADVFAQSSVWLLSATFGQATPPEDPWQAFDVIGLTQQDFTDLGAVAQNVADPDDPLDEDLYRHWIATPLTNPELIKEVLWLALGTELGVRPTIAARVYLVDFDNQIVLHPYDDRGMDVIATRKDALSGLYRKRYAWLLRHDLARMEAVFEDG